MIRVRKTLCGYELLDGYHRVATQVQEGRTVITAFDVKELKIIKVQVKDLCTYA
jgi:hypothetical protein